MARVNTVGAQMVNMSIGTASESGNSSPSEAPSPAPSQGGKVFTINLREFHRILAENRHYVMQDASSSGMDLPDVTVLSSDDLQIRVPTGDLLASIGDSDAELIRRGVANGGCVVIDPDTVTLEGLKLLREAFAGEELRVVEDKYIKFCYHTLGHTIDAKTIGSTVVMGVTNFYHAHGEQASDCVPVQVVHLLHVCLFLCIKYLVRSLDSQPEVFVSDNNCLAIVTCLFDHERTGGRLLRHCLLRLHRLWPKCVQRSADELRQALASMASMNFTDVLVDAFSLASDPSLGGFCNARLGYGMLLHLLRGRPSPTHIRCYCEALRRIEELPDKPLQLLPYLFAKQLSPSNSSSQCSHCHTTLLYTLLKSKCTPHQSGITEIHSTRYSNVVVWKVPRFADLTDPQYSFDFRTSQNHVLHMRLDPRGFGRGENTHLSLFVRESMGLEKGATFHFVLAVTSTTQDAFVRPMYNQLLSRRKREYTGRQAFMPLDVLRDNGYIERDGSLLVMLEVVEVPTPAPEQPSATDGA